VRPGPPNFDIVRLNDMPTVEVLQELNNYFMP